MIKYQHETWWKNNFFEIYIFFLIQIWLNLKKIQSLFLLGPSQIEWYVYSDDIELKIQMILNFLSLWFLSFYFAVPEFIKMYLFKTRFWPLSFFNLYILWHTSITTSKIQNHYHRSLKHVKYLIYTPSDYI